MGFIPGSLPEEREVLLNAVDDASRWKVGLLVWDCSGMMFVEANVSLVGRRASKIVVSSKYLHDSSLK
jgi:hypothetical protein